MPSESTKQDESMFFIALVLGYFISDLHRRYKLEMIQYPYRIFRSVKSWLFTVLYTWRTVTIIAAVIKICVFLTVVSTLFYESLFYLCSF